MAQHFKTEQEAFWAGKFGDDYIARNDKKSGGGLTNRIAIWVQILRRANRIKNCLEFGANIGLNLETLGIIFPELQMTAIEINEKAAKECSKLDRVTVYNESILNFNSDEKFDLTFTSGVLIHINPAELIGVYEKLYNYSNKYIVISEYYNPTPVEVNYRGNTGKLFKRDFAGEMMDRFSDLKLVDYGFVYHRDNQFTADDATWFLLEKM